MRGRELSLIVAVLFFWPQSLWAGWSGPEEVLSGTWGNADSEFGFLERYNKVLFPRQFFVDDDGNIIIADCVNRRAKVYSRNGKFKSIIKPKLPFEDEVPWPPAAITAKGGHFEAYLEGIIQHYSYEGGLAKQFRVPSGEFLGFLSDGNFIIHMLEKKEREQYAQDKGFGLFSPDGALLRASMHKPLEVGRSEEINEEKSNVLEAYTRIYYSDRTYTIINYPASNFFRGDKDNLFVFEQNKIMLYRCGIFQAELELPKAESEVIRPGDAQSAPIYEMQLEYGVPVPVPNGDVYAWKRTPTAYCILKWTWKDEDRLTVAWENEPRNLTAVTMADGIELLWDGSLQDPGCVTGYEIGRSTTSGGPYAKIAIVGQGVRSYLDTTTGRGMAYYYAVRSILGKQLSGYSNETQAGR